MMNQEQAEKVKKAITAAIFAVYKRYDNMGFAKFWSAEQILLFMDRCFDRRFTRTRKANPITAYARYYEYLGGGSAEKSLNCCLMMMFLTKHTRT